MPVSTVVSPDGKEFEVTHPEGASQEEIIAYAKANFSAPVVDKEAQRAEMVKSELMKPVRDIGNLAAGAIRGAGSIGATLLAPQDMLNDFLMKRATGKDVPPNTRREDMTSALESMGADPKSLFFQGGKIGGEIAGTAGVGPALGGASRLPGPIAQAIETAGLKAGGLSGAKGLATRALGGAITGGASAGLVDPEFAGGGAGIGAAMPAAVQAAGKVGQAVGRTISGPAQTAEQQAAIQSARGAGYVIPPSQAKPSLMNRALEGFAGKLTTAQNASAKNAEVTKALAAKAIGAPDLTPGSIQAVKDTANQAYDALAGMGSFKSDATFKAALASVQPATLPGVKNADVSALVKSLSKPKDFDAQAAIESLKQLRFEGFGNKTAQDPAKRALGNAQVKIAGELEKLIDRNLSASGNQDLLTAFREARQTLAKVHTVEKALNPATGAVDASVLARELRKGKPLTGELKTAAEFALSFPKAAQTVERMGSLPQSSPLDWGAMAALSAAAQNPLPMAGVLARPAARAAILSNPVQNRLLQSPSLLANPDWEQNLLRSAPVGLLSGR